MIPAPGGDEALAAAFAAHEPWAFGEAYRRHAALLYSAAYNVLGNADEAKDCVADAIARLWRSPRAYSSARGSLRNFLVVCVRNEAISHRRRQARRTRTEERLAGMTSDREELPAGDPIERDRVRRALRALPAEQRMAIALA
jgi:RNA polymerase sigma-70 factor, ECF subfamily